MNYQMLKYILGIAMLIVSVTLLFPFALSCLEGNWQVILAFALTWLISVCFTYFTTKDKPQRKSIYAKDGFVIVGLTWVLLSFIGALPYFISQTIPSFIDCLFESVSGFTTTGSSILRDIEVLPRSILLWRSLTHWVGGMGVLVFITAVVSFAGGNSMYLMRAESATPSGGKMTPKVKKGVAIIYTIYFALTALAFGLLMLGGIGWFDSLTSAFSVVATGGLSVRNASVGYYNSPYVEWVMIGFMLLCSINFQLIYQLFTRKIRSVFKNGELQAFLLILLLAILLVVPIVQGAVGGSFADNLRHAVFQLVSFMSTTGFVAADYSAWPSMLMIVFILIAMIGGCTGSTAGGFKVIRLIYVFKSIRREIRRMLHPNAVEVITVSGKPVDEEAISSVSVFFAAYIILLFTSLFFIDLQGCDWDTTFTAVCASLSNTGIGYGLVGYGGSFADFGGFSKFILIMDMLCGRLSVFPILFLLLPSVWSKRKNSQKLKI